MTQEKAKMEKLDGKTMDVVEHNIAQLQELFPEVFAEGKISFDKLQELLGNYLVEDEDHYNFTWHGKRQAGRLAQTPSTGTLRPARQESVDWNTTQNLFIEGDNLEVLKLLQKSYHRQVKMIYIDPPYNTGNDFVYEDDFKDGVKNYLELTGQLDGDGKKMGTNSSAAGRYHTNWLNMMYPRLKLARNLLKDDGVIFISIDDNELSNLCKVTDEIFGQENYLTKSPSIMVWQRAGTTAGHLASSHEYIVCYAKNKLNLPYFKLSEYGDDSFIEHGALKKISKANPASEITFPAGFEFQGKSAIFSGEIGGSEKQYITDEMCFENGKLAKPVTIKAGWAMKEQVESWINGKETFDTKGQRVIKFYFNSEGILWYVKERGTIHPKTVIDRTVVQSKSGAKDVEELMGINPFDYPKPVGLLKYLLSFTTSGDDIILDFFAGSGTTSHAAMQLNAEDDSNRRYISVQLPELTEDKSEAYKAGYKNIADISKERIRRAAKKIKEENPDYDGDLGFKVFKLDSSNIKRWEADFDTLEEDLLGAVDYIKNERSSDDVLYELLLKYGLDLTVPIETRNIAGKTVYSIGLGALVVCLEKDVSMDVVNGIGALKQELNPEIMRVVFKDEGFKDDVVKTNALQTLKRYGIEDIKSL